MMGRIQNLQSCHLCVIVFAPHVAFDHEIHVATSHAWVSSRFRRVLVCMTPRYVVSHTLLLRSSLSSALGVAVCWWPVRVRLLTPTPPSNPPTAIQGVLPMCRWLGKFQISLSRTGRRRGGSSLSHVWLSVADSRVVIMVVIAWPINVINVL